MENNYKMVGEGDTFYLIWSDAPVPLDKIHEMRRNQVKNVEDESSRSSFSIQTQLLLSRHWQDQVHHQFKR
jgi:hypothetical protein